MTWRVGAFPYTLLRTPWLAFFPPRLGGGGTLRPPLTSGTPSLLPAQPNALSLSTPTFGTLLVTWLSLGWRQPGQQGWQHFPVRPSPFPATNFSPPAPPGSFWLPLRGLCARPRPCVAWTLTLCTGGSTWPPSCTFAPGWVPGRQGISEPAWGGRLFLTWCARGTRASQDPPGPSPREPPPPRAP